MGLAHIRDVLRVVSVLVVDVLLVEPPTVLPIVGFDLRGIVPAVDAGSNASPLWISTSI